MAELGRVLSWAPYAQKIEQKILERAHKMFLRTGLVLLFFTERAKCSLGNFQDVPPIPPPSPVGTRGFYVTPKLIWCKLFLFIGLPVPCFSGPLDRVHITFYYIIPFF